MNYDEKTGIFYGVISQHSLNPDAANDIFMDGTDVNYETMKEELKDSFEQAFELWCEDNDIDSSDSRISSALDDMKDAIEEVAGESYESDSSNMEYESDGYHIITALDSDLMVLKSPFVTFAPPCSPCVPAAGNLDDMARLWKESEFYKSAMVTGVTAKTLNSGISPFYGDYNIRVTYCLGPDYFNDEKAPYPVCRINDEGNLLEWTFPERRML